jgi:L-2-hydroxyglutarate oxidase LhgO
MPAEVDVIIIGAGVVGLAIAAELSLTGKKVVVFEKNRTFGLETSSHNSEVIHAGMYYPENSLKAGFCVRGNSLLYEICERFNINHQKLGKLIVAADDVETQEIETLYRQGLKNGVQGLQLLGQSEIKKLEPDVQAVAALLSPNTGVIDSYYLLRSFYGRAKENGVDFIFNTAVVGIAGSLGSYRVSIKDSEGVSIVSALVVINAAGLFSDRVAALAGINLQKSGYKLHFCKGEYFNLAPRVGRLVHRLVYPVPEKAGLGVHVTLSPDGAIRLGPNFVYQDTIDYIVNENDKSDFYRAARRYLPSIGLDDLAPDFAGVRPKLQGPGEGFRDYIIRDEVDKGLPGLINLIGIESPGLTASPAIAQYVAAITAGYL